MNLKKYHAIGNLVRLKGLHIVWFYLYEILEMQNYNNGRLVVTRGMQERFRVIGMFYVRIIVFAPLLYKFSKVYT